MHTVNWILLKIVYQSKVCCALLFFLDHIRLLIWFAVGPCNWRGTNWEAGTGRNSGSWLWTVKLCLWGLLFWSLLLHLLLGENFWENSPSSQIFVANCIYVITDSALVTRKDRRHLLVSFLTKRKIKKLSSYCVGSILWRKFKKLINYNRVSPL